MEERGREGHNKERGSGTHEGEGEGEGETDEGGGIKIRKRALVGINTWRYTY